MPAWGWCRRQGECPVHRQVLRSLAARMPCVEYRAIRRTNRPEIALFIPARGDEAQALQVVAARHPPRARGARWFSDSGESGSSYCARTGAFSLVTLHGSGEITMDNIDHLCNFSTSLVALGDHLKAAETFLHQICYQTAHCSPSRGRSLEENSKLRVLCKGTLQRDDLPWMRLSRAEIR